MSTPVESNLSVSEWAEGSELGGANYMDPSPPSNQPTHPLPPSPPEMDSTFQANYAFGVRVSIKLCEAKGALMKPQLSKREGER